MLIHKIIWPGIWLSLALFLASSPALAQDISLFAWLDNDHIRVQCDTAPNNPVKDATIKVFDHVDNKELASGKTDSEGRFSFRVPQVVREGHGLLLSADAGNGRHGEWTMSAGEIYSAASLAAGFDEAAIQASENRRAHIPVKRSAQPATSKKPDIGSAAPGAAAATEKAATPQGQEPTPVTPDSAAPADLPSKLPSRETTSPESAAPASR